MVVLVADHLLHLLADDVEVAVCGIGAADIDPGNLCLDDEPQRVAEAQFIVAVGIVGEAQHIAPELLDDGVVAVDVSRGDGRGALVHILMFGDAAQGVGVAVE